MLFAERMSRAGALTVALVLLIVLLSTSVMAMMLTPNMKEKYNSGQRELEFNENGTTFKSGHWPLHSSWEVYVGAQMIPYKSSPVLNWTERAVVNNFCNGYKTTTWEVTLINESGRKLNVSDRNCSSTASFVEYERDWEYNTELYWDAALTKANKAGDLKIITEQDVGIRRNKITIDWQPNDKGTSYGLKWRVNSSKSLDIIDKQVRSLTYGIDWDDLPLFSTAVLSKRNEILISLPTATGDQFHDPVLSDSLIGYWSFDDEDISGGIMEDIHSSRNNGTVNEANNVSGNCNEALNFDGSNDDVNFSITSSDLNNLTTDNPRRPGYNSTITVSMWLNPDDTAGTQVYVDKGNSAQGWGIRMQSNQFTFLQLYDGATDTGAWQISSGDVNIDSWEMYTVTFDGNQTPVFYRNGSSTSHSVLDAPGFVADTDHAQPLKFGERSDGTSQSYDGQMDEVGIWSVELTSSLISDLYNSGNFLFIDI